MSARISDEEEVTENVEQTFEQTERRKMLPVANKISVPINSGLPVITESDEQDAQKQSEHSDLMAQSDYFVEREPSNKSVSPPRIRTRPMSAFAKTPSHFDPKMTKKDEKQFNLPKERNTSDKKVAFSPMQSSPTKSVASKEAKKHFFYQ